MQRVCCRAPGTIARRKNMKIGSSYPQRDDRPGNSQAGSTIGLPPELGTLALQAVEYAFAPSLAILAKAKSFCLYGAGEVGVLLFHLCQSRGLQPLAFLDDLQNATECCGIPVCPIHEGILRFQPEAILLATLRATERMTQNLNALPYHGKILHTRDSNAHVRSPHCRYVVTPKAVLRQFHNRHQGLRAFVIGNGPSLCKTDPRQLTNDITFAANNIFLLDGFKPTYYTAIDRVLTQDRAQEINALPWVKFFPHLVSEWITNGHFLNAIHADWPTNFSTDISEFIEIDFTVTYSLMQIAFYMGCTPVYLIGVDHSYAIDSSQCYQEGRILTSVAEDPNHFHPSYFGKGRRWTSPPPMEKLDACYRKASGIYLQHGRRLFNATAGGRLDVLPRVSFESLLPGTQGAGIP